VEEHFYLLLALGVAFTQRLNHGHITLDAFRFLPWLWAFVAATCLMLRLHVSLTLPFDVHTHLIPTHLRIDSLLAGAVLAWYMHHHFPTFCPQRRTRWVLLTLGTALFIPPFLWDFSQVWWVLPFGALFHAFGASLIILAGRCRQKHVSSLERGMAWVGARSYNIYLWHLPWLMWINPLLCRQLGVSQNWALCTASYLVGAILIGILITKIIEYPGLRIRNKLFPSLIPSQAPTT
jgi:peptidoglycan/LPS O-acetylase OafA/YrhL